MKPFHTFLWFPASNLRNLCPVEGGGGGGGGGAVILAYVSLCQTQSCPRSWCTYLVINGGGNGSTLWKPPPNPKSLATFTHALNGVGFRSSYSSQLEWWASLWGEVNKTKLEGVDVWISNPLLRNTYVSLELKCNYPHFFWLLQLSCD